MIKYLEVPDFHFTIKDEVTCLLNARAVKKAIKDYNIDFVVLPGDLHDKPIVSTHAGGHPLLINIIKSWLELCPVCAIEGTPSHDGPGAYAALEVAGLVLLIPGKVYGYKKSIGIHSFVISEMTPENSPDCILFGIPELNTDNIHARLNLSAEEGNAEAVNQFTKYIEHFIAPERARFKEIPAIGVLHGVVSDSASEFSDDVIIKASDIVIKTEILERAGLTRWSLGHIHTPWESEKICAGYAGSSGLNWNETGFIPAMNMIEIIDDDGEPRVHDIIKIPYGTPKRMKIKQPLDNYDPKIAYWLDTEDETAAFPFDGTVHPWSRITHRANKTVTRRITKEEAEKAKTLADTFKLFDPEVSESVLKKVGIIEKESSKEVGKSLNVKLKSLIVKGCNLFKGKTATLSTESITDLAMITGANGSGKSSLVAFCSPYPVIIGKDTKSGRQSAIKDFFSGTESSIEKIFNVEGKEHRHLINIKAAHTQSAKTECYLFIDGVSILECGTFDEMFLKCEELYGAFDDYLLTTFYVQPLQGKTGSSLMTASMIEIRNLVQSIAGIDREKEKRIALDSVSDIETKIQNITNWLDGAKNSNLDINELIDNKKILVNDNNDKQEQLSKIKSQGELLKKEFDILSEKNTINEKEISRKEYDQKLEHNKRNELQKIKFQTAELEELVKQKDELETQYKKLKSNEKALLENRKLKNDYDTKVIAYRQELNKKQEEAREFNTKADATTERNRLNFDMTKNTLESLGTSIRKEIKAINKPCFNCGKINPEAEKEIEKLNNQLMEAEKKLNELFPPKIIKTIPVPTELVRPLPTPPQYLPTEKIEGDEEQIERKLEEIRNAEAMKTTLKESAEKHTAEIDRLQTEQYCIDNTIKLKLDESENKLDDLRNKYNDLKSESSAISAKIEMLDKQIDELKKNEEKIKAEESNLIILESDLVDWKYIAAQLQSSKIPAMELDIILNEIDEEATKNICPYRDGIFSFKTVTQVEGKKSTVDRFDITVHDNETGIDKSFIEFSPGQKAFLNDAYVKALIMKRNERSRKTYSPIIIDEADGPIHQNDIPSYYEMQQKYWNNKNTNVLVISHAENTHQYISKHISIEEVLV
jgi:hypothetical protein